MASADQRSAAEIEREIEEERSALGKTLDEIQDRLSFESLSGDLFDQIRESGGDMGRTVARGVRDNPIPLGIAAIGLAWFVANRMSHARQDDDPYARVAASPASAHPVRDYRDPSASAAPGPLYDESGRPIPGGESSRWDRARSAARHRGHEASEAARGWADEASGHLRAGAASARGSFASGAERARSGLSQLSGAARKQAKGAYASAADLRERITEGTEELSSQARARVLAARTRAYEAQLRAEHYAARSREKASDFFDDQPLVVGALALAAGAAIGSMLPRTSREDAAFGAYRDQVFDEAERVYRDERAKLEAVARETSREAQEVGRDVFRDVKKDVEDGVQRTGDIARGKFEDAQGKVRDAAKDVADTAKTEAENKNLGQQG